VALWVWQAETFTNRVRPEDREAAQGDVQVAIRRFARNIAHDTIEFSRRCMVEP
jgi:hypothetical protein